MKYCWELTEIAKVVPRVTECVHFNSGSHLQEESKSLDWQLLINTLESDMC